MRIEQLEYFYALASLKTIQAVSEQFYTSPQVVSKAIQKLEKELNTLLFVRTRKGLELTEDGADIYPYVEDILTNYRYLQHNYIAQNPAGITDLHILSSKGTIPYFTALIKSLNAAGEGGRLNLIIQVESFQEVKFLLAQKNDFDIITTVATENDLSGFYRTPAITRHYAIALGNRGPLRLYLHKSSPWTNRDKISLKQLKNLPLIKYNLTENDFDHYLKEQHHLTLRYPLQVSEIALALELVNENQGCFFAPEFYINNMFTAAQRKYLASVPLEVDYFQNEVFFVSKKALQNPAFSGVLKLLKADLVF